ncbi:hypothetical protein N2152v2_000883 [Parachlorella kessleri]
MTERGWVVTPETIADVLKAAATPTGEVIFTTLVFDVNLTGIDMVQNFGYWLNRHGLLEHTLILATDNHTWEALHSRGLPGYWDMAWPIPSYIPEGANDVPGSDDVRTFDLQKHWWGLQVVKHGYKALYLDSDAVIIQNPLPPFEEPFDVQGLSDWQDADLPPTGGMVWRDCGNYKWAPIPKDKHVAYGALAVCLVAPVELADSAGASLYAWWHLRTYISKARAQPIPNPCQSTGVWYLQPTEVTIRFMTSLYNRLTEEFRSQWDQTAWNEIIMGYLVTMGTDIPGMRYRLLPHAQYSNIDVAKKRKNQGLPVDQVILHAGYYHGKDKGSAGVLCHLALRPRGPHLVVRAGYERLSGRRCPLLQADNYREQGLYHADYIGHIAKSQAAPQAVARQLSTPVATTSAGGPSAGAGGKVPAAGASAAAAASVAAASGCSPWFSGSLSSMVACVLIGCTGGLLLWPFVTRRRGLHLKQPRNWAGAPLANGLANGKA